jgi:hypothetical protein
MPNVLLLPECNADTGLITFLMPSTVEIDHADGIHAVDRQMRQTASTRPNYTIVGIVDKDRDNVPPDFLEFLVVQEYDEKLTFKHRPETNQYLIVLDKAIETFLLWNAAQVGLRVESYGFSEDLKRFCKAIKRTTIKTDPDYLRLLADLRSQQAPGFVTLQRLLHELVSLN